MTPAPRVSTGRFLIDNAPWLGAGAMMSFLSAFGQTFLLSVFAAEIMAEFGLTDGGWGLTYTVGTGLSAAIMVWAGGLADRFRVRVLGSAVLVCLALSCLFMAGNRMVALLPLAILALRLFGQGMASHVALVAMARWFVATRGRALAVATFGFAAAEATLPLTLVAAKRVLDWRTLFVLMALVALLAIPLLWALLRTERTPQADAEVNVQAGMDGRHWTRAEALRHPLFWALAPSLMAFPAFATAFWFHQVHFAELKGWSHLSFVALFPLGTAAFLGSTIVYGWLIDRFGTGPLLPIYLLPVAAAFTVHAWGPTLPWGLAGVVLMGLAGGGQATLPSACWAEFFGTRHIGSIKAAVAALMVLGSALGPGISGLLIDAGVDLPMQYQAYAVIFLACAALVLPVSRRARATLPAPA
ncbi:MFS transporter [Wenxinia saemankumensis]|uniref:Predicted arabinose efflux permease, MFS family n=1 Tax=Wenxinia saemankumensis TaxID=1447782 RepID=A0A1M6G2K0_9RHOB|nr:MFS transporter [Wenxinia saemankumensis]SHJ04195.1 Predicted arabinose efflux permease, MFS family [Wenxinia saemankumensis]